MHHASYACNSDTEGELETVAAIFELGVAIFDPKLDALQLEVFGRASVKHDAQRATPKLGKPIARHFGGDAHATPLTRETKNRPQQGAGAERAGDAIVFV